MLTCTPKQGELTIVKLLYSKRGMGEGVKLWKEFVKLRNETGARLRDARGEGYGWGELEPN